MNWKEVHTSKKVLSNVIWILEEHYDRGYGSKNDVSIEAHTLEALVKYCMDMESALHQEDHYVIFNQIGSWAIEHLVSCRPDMTECEIHKAMQEQNWHNVYREGRYKVFLNDNGHVEFRKESE